MSKWIPVLALWLAGQPAAAQLPPSPLPLDWCRTRALEANPALLLDAARSDAARERVGYAGALEDPRFSYEASNLPVGDLDFTSTPLSGHQLGLRQRLPFPGVRAGRRTAAESGSEASARLVDHRRLMVAAEVEAAWADLGLSQRALEITDRNLELLRQLVRVVEARYRVGTGLQQDALRAHVELTRLLDQRVGLDAALARASARLSALLDLSPGSVFPRTAALIGAAPIPELEPAASRLESIHPRLAALRARIDEAERMVRVTELESRPDVDLGIGYRIRQRGPGDPVDGDDFLAAGVTIRLPVDRAKWRARVAERRASVRAAEAAYRLERAALRSALHEQHAALVAADATVALLDTGLVPQARQSLAANRSGYEVGKIDFPALIDSQVRLLDAELRLVRARAARRRAFAALESAAGEALR